METNMDVELDNSTPNGASPTTPHHPLSAAEHKVNISRALSLHPPGSPTRDVLLLSSLRSIATELESAEEDAARAQKRLNEVKEMFEKTAELLSGKTDVSLMPKGEKIRKRGRKRKGEEEADGDYDERFVPPDEGPLIPPMIATGGGGMTEMEVYQHRREFYDKLTEGHPFESLHEYLPPVTQPNLRTRAQLDEYVYVAKHWNTGTDTLDVKAFRRQYKGFYMKMKVSTENVGRRTGHHLRYLAGSNNRQVFCRYGKNGESLMYVALEDLYDAIFELHCLKGHRGWQSCKKLANLKYANLPQDQIKLFLDTCPFCLLRKRVKTEVPAVGGAELVVDPAAEQQLEQVDQTNAEEDVVMAEKEFEQTEQIVGAESVVDNVEQQLEQVEQTKAEEDVALTEKEFEQTGQICEAELVDDIAEQQLEQVQQTNAEGVVLAEQELEQTEEQIELSEQMELGEHLEQAIAEDAV